MERAAFFSPCGLYRYRLSRVWNPELPHVVWMMLNPSSADAERDDPTIRRCIGFSRAGGFGALHVVNLWAFRAVSPFLLFGESEPIGEENEAYLRESVCSAAQVVLAWGVHGGKHGRAEAVCTSLKGWGVQAVCLGRTKDGQPRHPLYLPAAASFEPFF